MAADLLDRLEQSFLKLIAALDKQETEAIIDAAAAIRPIVYEVENNGAWYEDKMFRTRLKNLSRLMNSARYRVNKLTDINSHRVQILTQANGAITTQTYQKPQ